MSSIAVLIPCYNEGQSIAASSAISRRICRTLQSTFAITTRREHVPNDTLALAHMHWILEPDGGLALLVPAFPFLRGSIDDLVGHYRHYGRRELADKLIRAGFSIKKLFFMNAPGIVGWFLNNRAFRYREESPAQIAFYDTFVVPWLNTVEDFMHPPFGLSSSHFHERNNHDGAAQIKHE